MNSEVSKRIHDRISFDTGDGLIESQENHDDGLIGRTVQGGGTCPIRSIGLPDETLETHSTTRLAFFERFWDSVPLP